jgi:hypothetical protein
MEFKIRVSNSFVMNMCLVILASMMAIWSFFALRSNQGVLHYFFILWAVIALVRFSNYSRCLYIAVKGDPALVVNTSYIYDVVNNIKYYWKDVEELYDENSYLYINLHNPGNYAENISDPLRKMIITWRLSENATTPFKINIDVVNVNNDVLLEILDNYSIQAEENGAN